MKPLFSPLCLVILILCSSWIQAQNVGIDVANPAGKLHVKTNSTVSYPQLLLEEDDNDYARLTFKNSTATKTWSVAAYPSDVDSQAWFNIYNSATGNLLVLNGKGKLGIDAVPAYPLSFNNNLGDKIALWGGGGYGPHYGFGIQTSLLQIHTANSNDDVAFGYGSSGSFTENVRITGDGKMGIGNNDPVFPLSFASANGDKIALYGNNPTSHYGFGIQASLMQIHSSSSATDIAFGYGGSGAFTEHMRVKGNGRVGIGTNTPDSRLHVYNGAAPMEPNPNALVTFENTASTYLNLLSGGETGLLFGADANGTDGAIIYNNNASNQNGFSFRTNGNVNRMLITAEGNVGIGNFTPAFPLSFPSTLGDKITLWGGNPNSHFGFGIQPGVLQIMTGESTSDVVFGYGGSNAFTEGVRITGDGKLGIGTTDPGAALEVNGFSKLGSGAPKIKIMKLTSTTASGQGGTVSITHGIDENKILSVDILVDSGTWIVPPCYTFNNGLEFNFYIYGNDIVVKNITGNSGSILSKPLRILVTYEE